MLLTPTSPASSSRRAWPGVLLPLAAPLLLLDGNAAARVKHMVAWPLDEREAPMKEAQLCGGDVLHAAFCAGCPDLQHGNGGCLLSPALHTGRRVCPHPHHGLTQNICVSPPWNTRTSAPALTRSPHHHTHTHTHDVLESSGGGRE